MVNSKVRAGYLVRVLTCVSSFCADNGITVAEFRILLYLSAKRGTRKSRKSISKGLLMPIVTMTSNLVDKGYLNYHVADTQGRKKLYSINRSGINLVDELLCIVEAIDSTKNIEEYLF